MKINQKQKIRRQIATEKRKLTKLKAKNEKLKARNKRLVTTNRSLEKKNTNLRNKIIRQRRIIRAKIPIPKEEITIYRYSIAYFNANYDKTFRAEVYTTQQQGKDIQRQLDNFLRNRISHLNKGAQRIFHSSAFVGIESEQIGNNDLGQSELNRMHFWID